MHVS
jgi:hypothetical protein